MDEKNLNEISKLISETLEIIDLIGVEEEGDE